MTQHSRDTPQFYLTAPSPCPYLAGKEERKVFTHLVGERAPGLNDLLTQGGFRRSQNIAYMPYCEGCHACVPVRVLVDEFEPSRSFRRILDKNRDLAAARVAARPTAEQYTLFRDYIDARHSDGGMADMTVLDFAMMVEESIIDTRMTEYRVRPEEALSQRPGTGALAAVALCDYLSDGISMVYSFYDPATAERSLGTYMILEHIEQARRLGLPYLYLGYWIGGSRKMAYKTRFTPQERLTSNGWVRV